MSPVAEERPRGGHRGGPATSCQLQLAQTKIVRLFTVTDPSNAQYFRVGLLLVPQLDLMLEFFETIR